MPERVVVITVAELQENGDDTIVDSIALVKDFKIGDPVNITYELAKVVRDVINEGICNL